MKIRLTKGQFDKLVIGLKQIIDSEIENVRANIDVNQDGYVDFSEFKIVIKSIMKALKRAIRGMK